MSKLFDLLGNIIRKVNSSVSTEEQVLTEEQKAQVRENINAASKDEAGVEQVQADWSQNDNTQVSYIKNKPFYETTVDIPIVIDGIVTFTAEGMDWGENLPKVDGAPEVEVGQTVKVVVDGDAFIGEVYKNSIDEILVEVDDERYVYFYDDFVQFSANKDYPDGTYKVSIYLVQPVLVKLDNKFIDSSNTLDENDNRPVTSAAVKQSFDSLHKSVQSDWDQRDNTQTDYIKNRPFGLEAGEDVVNTTLSWTCTTDEMMSTTVTWDEDSFSSFCPDGLNTGTYLVKFNEKQSVVSIENGYSGKIETDFISLVYERPNMFSTQIVFTIVSQPPTYSTSSSQFILTPVTVKQIDPTYITFPEQKQVNWNQSDETKTDFIQNRTHWDTVTGEWEELFSHYEDEMEGTPFSEVDVGAIYFESNCEYSVCIGYSGSTSEAGDMGEKIRPYLVTDGMNDERHVIYNGKDYVRKFDIITLPSSTYYFILLKRAILSPMKQLDEKFIPDTIARVSDVQTSVNNQIGDLSVLQTTDKTNVVAAINEVLQKETLLINYTAAEPVSMVDIPITEEMRTAIADATCIRWRLTLSGDETATDTTGYGTAELMFWCGWGIGTLLPNTSNLVPSAENKSWAVGNVNGYVFKSAAIVGADISSPTAYPSNTKNYDLCCVCHSGKDTLFSGTAVKMDYANTVLRLTTSLPIGTGSRIILAVS